MASEHSPPPTPSHLIHSPLAQTFYVLFERLRYAQTCVRMAHLADDLEDRDNLVYAAGEFLALAEEDANLMDTLFVGGRS